VKYVEHVVGESTGHEKFEAGGACEVIYVEENKRIKRRRACVERKGSKDIAMNISLDDSDFERSCQMNVKT
jgi:hypothetical protein